MLFPKSTILLFHRCCVSAMLFLLQFEVLRRLPRKCLAATMLWFLPMHPDLQGIRQRIVARRIFLQRLHITTCLWTGKQRKHDRDMPNDWEPSFCWMQGKVLLWRRMQQGRFTRSRNNWAWLQQRNRENTCYQRQCTAYKCSWSVLWSVVGSC